MIAVTGDDRPGSWRHLAAQSLSDCLTLQLPAIEQAVRAHPREISKAIDGVERFIERVAHAASEIERQPATPYSKLFEEAGYDPATAHVLDGTVWPAAGLMDAELS